MKSKFAAALVTISTTLTSVPVGAVEISMNDTGDVMLQGLLDTDDWENFIEPFFLSLEPNQHRTIHLHLGGGDLWVADKVADWISTNGWDTTVPANAMCYSSCMTILMAGANRYVSESAEMMVHAFINKRNMPIDEFAVRVEEAIPIYMKNLERHAPNFSRWMGEQNVLRSGTDTWTFDAAHLLETDPGSIILVD